MQASTTLDLKSSNSLENPRTDGTTDFGVFVHVTQSEWWSGDDDKILLNPTLASEAGTYCLNMRISLIN